jgi:hypothetical protein
VQVVSSVEPQGVHKSVRREAGVVSHEMVWKALPLVTRWIAESRAARLPADYNEIQRQLASGAIEIRDLDLELKAEKRHVLDEIRGVARHNPDRGKELQAALADLDERLVANRRRLVALRSVQDGIFWRLWNFDRGVISTLGLGPQVGYPSQNFESEVAAAGEFWAEGKIALLTDLSSCIRSGDLVVFDPETGRYRIGEIKVSDAAIRQASRQRVRLEARTQFLAEGRSSGLGAYEMPVLSAQVRPTLRTHLATLGSLLEKARRQVIAGARVSSHLHVIVLDGRAALELVGDDEDAALARLAKKHARLTPPAEWQRQEVVAFHSHERLQRDEHAGTATTAPYSIFPFDDETCAALCLGLVSCQVTLNLTAVYDEIRRRGWGLEPPPPEPPDMWFTAVDVASPTNLLVQGVNVRLREQLLVELLSLEAFGDFVAAGFEEARGEHERTFALVWGWSGEDRVWL